MPISSIHKPANSEYISPIQGISRDSASTTSRTASRSRGDSILISNEAMEMYMALKNTSEENNEAKNLSKKITIGKHIDPKELEKKLKEWQEKQIFGQYSGGTSINGESDSAQASSKTSGQGNSTESPEGMSASEEFSAYMKSKRSKGQGGSAEDRVKQLQDRLKSLQSQLSQMTSGNELHGADDKEIENIQSQINTTVEQLAEASAQAAEEKMGATSNK